MSGAYTVKKVSGDEFNLLIPLMQDCFGMDVSVDYFKWKYLDNPSGSFIGFVAIDHTGEVGAYYGVIPELYSIHGQKKVIFQSCDTMTHSRHRRKGLFQLLATKTYEYLHQQSKLFVIGFGGGQSAPGLTKFGWRNLFPVRHYFSHRLLLQTVSLTMDLLSSPLTGTVTEVNDTSSVSALMLESNANSKVHAVKSAEICQWRVRNPLHHYKLHCYKSQNNHTEGYLITYVSRNKLYLFDFYSVNRMAERALFRKLVEVTRREHVSVCVTFANHNSDFRKVLSRNGFIYNDFSFGPLNKTLQIPFMYFAKEQLLNEKDEVSDAWNISMFEHDAA